MPDVLTMMLTSGSRMVIRRFEELESRGRDACERFIVKVGARFNREAIEAFEKKAQPGGDPWAPNQGTEPGGYAWFKATMLGLRGNSTGYVNGELRNSITTEVNKGALESRTGTPKESGLSFTEGGPSKIFFAKDRDGRWWGFGWKHENIPGRPFLPAVDWAETTMAEMMRQELVWLAQQAGA